MNFLDERLPCEFWESVSRDESSDCWVWIKPTKKESNLKFTDRPNHQTSPVRFAYQAAFGSCPRFLIRTCSTAFCVNPKHHSPKNKTLDHRLTYESWIGMHARCGKPHHKAFHYYGGRGIVVCEQWTGRTGFARFLSDMGERPSSAHSIDRIDVNGNYELSNCRWATASEQSRNQRRTVLSESAVAEIWSLSSTGLSAYAIGKRLGVHDSTVRNVLRRARWADLAPESKERREAGRR